MKTMFSMIALAGAIAAVPASAQVMSKGDYVATAGASDLYERQSSQIVLETTTNPDLKQFAQMMIQMHTQTTAEVKRAATKDEVRVLPPMLTPAQSEMIAQLSAETGMARDGAYIAQQKQAHGQALDVQKAYAMEGTAPALRDAAAKIVPVVQDHITILMKM